MEEIIGAHNFYFAPKFLQMGICGPKLRISRGKILTRIKSSNALKFAGRSITLFTSVLTSLVSAYQLLQSVNLEVCLQSI